MNITSSINRPLLILTVLLISSGCYTVLNHPAVETSTYDYDYASCYDCHTHAFFSPSYARMPYPGLWNDYYHDPWWHSEILITGEDGVTFRRSVIPGRDFRSRDSQNVGSQRNYDPGTPVNVSPGTPRSIGKKEQKVEVRKRRTTRSRSDDRNRSRDRSSRKRTSGKKKKKERDRD
ncbi:MAG: hypothetical protein GF417_06645 [Candidatus Latescibacteria bacterium]|nr:hypothetical protein [bacterium]MBD3424096.1 hypothetical protein [Candidatus Latescibacterota bacterium]